MLASLSLSLACCFGIPSQAQGNIDDDGGRPRDCIPRFSDSVAETETRLQRNDGATASTAQKRNVPARNIRIRWAMIRGIGATGRRAQWTGRKGRNNVQYIHIEISVDLEEAARSCSHGKI